MKYILKLNNGKQRKRYLISMKTPLGTINWASVLHCAESLNIPASKIYKNIKNFINQGTILNTEPQIRRIFCINDYNLIITIQNTTNESIKLTADYARTGKTVSEPNQG